MDLTFITPLFIIQFTSLMLFIAALIFGILTIKKFDGLLGLFIIPLLTYIVHIIGFYSFVLYTSIIGTREIYVAILNGWGAGIRLHLALLFATEFLILFFRGEKWMRPK
jgi:hypothetical protein